MSIKTFFIATATAVLGLPVAVFAENYPYRDDALWVATPDRADWIYETGDSAVIDISLYRYGVPAAGVTVNYTIGDDNLPDDTKGTIVLDSLGRGVVNIGTMERPGFRDLRLGATMGDDGFSTAHHVKVGFSPDKLRAFTGEPADFDAFWSNALKEDARFPLTYSIEPVEKYTTDKMTCSLVKLQLDSSGRCMWGYLFIPKGGGRYPAVLCPPGAGVKTIKEPMYHRYYGEGGMIRAEIEIHGAHPELSEQEFASLRKEKGDYLKFGLENPEEYYMK
ncbi:MAG: acetylxylan esterase, partial [Duncaniella sp.]|nr:acetylxylan esterase [Duncaniella sp.]